MTSHLETLGERRLTFIPNCTSLRVMLKDDGMTGQTTGQHGHHRAITRAAGVHLVVLTTEWATTGQKTARV